MSSLVYDIFNTFMWLLIDDEGRSIAQIIFCFIIISSFLVLLKLKDEN